MFGGIQLIVSEFALQDSDIRLFPESKNRSARIHKKLVKRFGGEFKKVPAIWQIEDRLVVHPLLMHTVRQAIADSRREPSINNDYGINLIPPRPQVEPRPRSFHERAMDFVLVGAPLQMDWSS
jgi:hypothetical protein